MKKWHTKIHDLLRHIPSVKPDNLKQHFHSIDSKLVTYESLKDVASLLELAVWKAKILEQADQNNDNVSIAMKMGCRIKCGATVIIPNVLSFLLQD